MADAVIPAQAGIHFDFALGYANAMARNGSRLSLG
jgi:hypothetical protein